MKDIVKRKRKHASLVERLRAPSGAPPYPDFAILVDKVDAIGEALAYLIEKKHMKLRVKRNGG